MSHDFALIGVSQPKTVPNSVEYLCLKASPYIYTASVGGQSFYVSGFLKHHCLLNKVGLFYIGRIFKVKCMGFYFSD